MKKFYENPVVEVTVFDTEDVMAASGVPTGTISGSGTANAAAIEEFVSAYNNQTSFGGKLDVQDAQAYGWGI